MFVPQNLEVRYVGGVLQEFLRHIKREFAKLVTLLQAYALISTGVRMICTNQVSSLQCGCSTPQPAVWFHTIAYWSKGKVYNCLLSWEDIIQYRLLGPQESSGSGEGGRR